MPKKYLYLAGPMSGMPDLNHPTFNRYAEQLRADGWEVFNPAEADLQTFGSTENTIKRMEEDRMSFLRTVLDIDLGWICCMADAIALIPGWENSKGARAEYATASALGLEIINLT